ncbi:MAG: hypothetical protein K6F75_00285 [Butyrivibrio sp.]|nr:hypothetical protein [Butyrivibrio sp.]
MLSRGVFYKVRICLGTMAAIFFAVMAGLLMSDVVKTRAGGNLSVATQCSFVIPSEFEPDEEQGLFRHKDYPMESSSIKYNIYYNGQDKVLTNREKQALLRNGELSLVDESENLTKEIYQDTMSKAYSQEYGQDVSYEVTSFSKKSFDGFPGFKITAELQPAEDMKVYQTAYIILSRYRTFSITYQRAEDDECEDLFNTSAATIHVR